MNGTEANPNIEKKCPRCGVALPPGALEGLCPACLLKQGATAETGPEPTPFEPPSVEQMSRLFTSLEILAFIGKGGMGAVYKARQPALDRLVAIKVISPGVVSEPGFADRFNREARALAKLSHPNIVGIHEFGEIGGLRYFIMEFVDGLTLRELERSGKLSSREALLIVPQICAALQFAHDEGIVHRDIKPENILMDKRGRVKIADFGIAKIMGRDADANLFQTQGAIGTPQYMAPEQLETPQSVDHRADIFSLGVVFYEMLTGELPMGKFSPPSGKVRVDVRLDEVVLRALEKEPHRRYQQASEVKTAVETIAGAPGISLPPPADHALLAQQILARDYNLDIESCIRRGWELLKANFWPLIGVTAFGLLLTQAAWSTIVGFVAGGPLMAGLSLYYLKKIRKEKVAIGALFSGFSIAFVDLFLAGMITVVLTALGFVCLVLPGIFLCVIWWFPLTLIIDKRIPFWPAMELSRKVVMKHFWKFLGLWLMCMLIYAAGILMCGIGFFLTAPIAFAAMNFAYQDIFCDPALAANQAASGSAPSGTKFVHVGPPVATAGPAASQPAFWRGAFIVLGVLAAFWITMLIGRTNHMRNEAEAARYRETEAARSLAQTPPGGNDTGALTPGTSAKEADQRVKENLETRMEATAAMASPDEKVRALVQLASDAAEAGQGDIVLRIIGQIPDPQAHDQAAQDAAIALDKHGQKKFGVQVAKLITDPSKRDAALSELAR